MADIFTDLLSEVTFTGEEARSAILDPAFMKPEISEFHTVVPGIVTTTQVAFAERMAKFTRVDTGQTDAITSDAAPYVQKTWSPVKMLTWIKQKAADIEASFLIYAQRRGVRRAEIDGTIVEDFMIEQLKDGMAEDALRQAWFSDTTHSLVGAGSGTELLTAASANVLDYTVNDGFWKQIYTGVTASKINRVTISENSAASTALQLNLAADTAYDTFVEMIEKADKRLKRMPGSVIRCTDTMFDNLLTTYESKGVSESFVRRFENFTVASVRGVPVYPFDLWDRYIASDFDNTTTLHQPHRAVLYLPQTMQIGVDDASAMQDHEAWYERKEREYHIRGAYRADYMLAREWACSVAY